MEVKKCPYCGKTVLAISKICKHCGKSFEEMPQPVNDNSFLMKIEDVFSITGRGTVVTGQITKGNIQIGDIVQITGIGVGEENRQSVVTGIEMFRKICNQAQKGDNVGLLLRGINKDELKQGMVITKIGTHNGGNVNRGCFGIIALLLIGLSATCFLII
jgi:translation elongation factor EF-Tu-like GTPase